MVNGQQLLNADGYATDVVPFLKTHCLRCHGEDSAESDLRLDTLQPTFSDSQSAATWIEVMDKINLGEMPPDGEPQPRFEDASAFTDWIAQEIRHMARQSRSTGGRVLMRRLNRTEYANIIRDLLKVNFLSGEGPRELLPPDGTMDGFDKVSKALLLDPSLMEKYFEVAEMIADKAIQLGPPPVPTRRNRMEYENISGGIEYIKESRTTIVTDDGLITMSHGMRSDEQLKHPWNGELIPTRGRYRLRVRMGADVRDRDALYIRISRSGDGDIYFGKVPGTIEQPEVLEVVRDFDVAGGGEIGINFEDAPSFGRVNYHFSALQKAASEASAGGNGKLAGRLRAQMLAQGFPNQGRQEPDSLTTDHMPRIFFDWIELEGPLYEKWPPASTEQIFHRGLAEADLSLVEAETYATEIFSRLLPLAFRQPVHSEDVANVVAVVTSEIQHGESFVDAIRSGVVTMLCSPRFLLVNEPVPGDHAESQRRLNDYEIAFRLSLFLWSSLPDDALRKDADAGRLNDSETLLQHVRRMLKDDKASALVEGFARQWLKADQFDRFAVDQNLYREFYSPQNAGINEAINREPLEFFQQLLQQDGPATDFLDSDWTMANETLARYYGIPGVTGTEFVRVKLPDDLHRGGLTSMAAIHKWGSDGNRTKPVERGKYILDVLFNDPPKPPPPNAGEVEPNVSGENLTVRQRLDQHRTIPACASCHRTIDPYGMALENFNVIGQWRTKQDGERPWWPDEAAIDVSGSFPNGQKFETYEEFQTILRSQSTRFLRGLCEKMFVYAMGRIVEPSDRITIDLLVRRMEKNNHTFRSLIEGIVLSDQFLTK